MFYVMYHCRKFKLRFDFRELVVGYLANCVSLTRSSHNFSSYLCSPLIKTNINIIRMHNTVVRNQYIVNVPTKYSVDIENILAHEVLENNDAYGGTVIVHPLKTIKDNYDLPPSTSDVVGEFYEVTVHNLKKQRTLKDSQFTNLITSLVHNIPNVSFGDMQLVFHCLCLWPHCESTYVRNFQFLWHNLDRECTKRLKIWSTDEKLLIGDYWYHLRLSRISRYNTSMIKDLIASNALTSNQFVQLTFFIILQRTISQSVFNIISNKFESVIGKISLDEISIICLSYFKNETKLNNNRVLKNIIERTITKIDDIDDVTIVRILKFLRKSFHSYIIQFYANLINSCISNVPRWNLLAAVHIASLCSASFIFEPQLLDAIVLKLQDNIFEARLKDFRKVVQCLSQFNYLSHLSFHDILFKEIMKTERKEESKAFPIDLLNLLTLYSYLGKYPLDIINYVLNQEFVEHCESKCDVDLLYQLVVLDYCVEIECDNYDGPRLKADLLSTALKQHENMSDRSNRDTSVLVNSTKKVLDVLESVINPNDFILCRIMPHIFNLDIIVRLTSYEESLPMKQVVSFFPSTEIIRPPVNESWGCFVICGPFSNPFKSKRLSGLLTMKQRQLTKLGYKVVLLPFQDIPSETYQRKMYLKHKFNSFYENTDKVAQL